MTTTHFAAHFPGVFAVNSLGPINSFWNTSGTRFWFSKSTVQRPLISIWKSDRTQLHVVKISGAPIQLSLPTYRLAATGRINSQDFTSNDAFDHEPFWLSLIKDLLWSLKSLAIFLAEQPSQLKYIEWPIFQSTLKTASLTLVLVALLIVALSSVDSALCYMLSLLLRKAA